ncbi:MAG: polysaccharide pyruvyl transferase family protein [Parabacteroides sp.]|nr:polysaccharide pyruvyl transferase family protein [Parabacteroides sp.]
MRIGILTFHRAINYGAFLQAFALKTYLTKLGHQVEIVDYWPEGHADIYRLIPNYWKKRSFIGKIRFFISLILRYSRTKKRIEGMQMLVKKYFGLTSIPSYPTAKSLKYLSYDCIIYGSDQIWWKSKLPGYSGFDPIYWGESISNSIKKIAYAPSMGIIDLSDEDKKDIRKWLKNFNVLSVREVDLADTIKEIANYNIPVVLDPVFLLSKQEWINYCKPINKDKYILYYNLLPSKEADLFVKKLQKKYKCQVLEITGNVNPLKIGKQYIQSADAIDFISLIKNAEFVVTSSFHGTAFSIIFEKQFFSIGMEEKSGRVKSLLHILKLEKRLITSYSNEYIPDIDYSNVERLLDIEITKSKKYLEHIK